ncbi:MAG: hypothetical protein LC659_11310, partial [Myxococcales bacterium]|nr:hypothetical protein [Myxococcales bacterium]
VAGVLVLVAGAGLGAHKWRKAHVHSRPSTLDRRQPQPEIVAEKESHASASPAIVDHLPSTVDANKPTIVASPTIKRRAPREKAPPPPPVGAPRSFELAPTPKAVTVFLDGRRLGEYGPELDKVAVPPGRHTVRFESLYCFPKDVDIDDAEPPGRLAARLRWKPARLTVKTDPESADVLVDGSVLRSGQQIDVTIPEMSDGKKLVAVKVSAASFASQTVSVELRANDQRVQNVTLHKSAAE